MEGEMNEAGSRWDCEGQARVKRVSERCADFATLEWCTTMRLKATYNGIHGDICVTCVWIEREPTILPAPIVFQPDAAAPSLNRTFPPILHILNSDPQEVPEFTLRSVEVMVFDEADRLFEMGFAEQLREIMRGVPEERQSLLFSATMPKQLVQFARAGLKDPVLIRLDTESKISTELR